MTLRHFDDELDLQRREGVTTTVVVTENVVITRAPEPRSTHLLTDAPSWGWEQVRDYVVSAIESRFGAFPRNFKTEHSIFKSFCSRWGPQAGPIAIYAFEVEGGYWGGAPISVNRFCKGSDLYFSAEIAKRLDG